MTSVMCLNFSMQEENVLEHTNNKCHLCTLSSTCRLLCNKGIHLTMLIGHTRAKILVSALERQVSPRDTCGEVVGH